MLKYLLLPPLVLAAGCASMNGFSSSYVGPGLTNNAAKLIANNYINDIKNRLPPATTTLIIQKNNPTDNFTPLFVNLLRQKGYRVIYTDQPKKQQNMGVNLLYRLTPQNDGRIISILQYDWAGEPSYHISIF